jgi:CRP-like cAMP-binding protein
VSSGLETEVRSLRAVPMFKDLETARLKLIAFTSERLNFPEGATMFRQGEPSDSAYVIIDGVAQVMLDTPNGPVTVAELGRNALIGEMGVITGSNRSATIMVRSSVTALRLPKEVFLGLLAEFPPLSLAVMRDLAKRLDATNARLVAAQSAGHS